VRALEAKLAKYRKANRKLKRRIQRLINEQSVTGETDDADIDRRAQNLQRQSQT
jgi:hypothetical protein